MNPAPQSRRPLVVAALPTPFDEHEELHLAGVEKLAVHLVGAGCDALFVGGTTGEYPALQLDERVRLVEAAVEAVGAEHIIAHVGSSCARDSEYLSVQVSRMGVTDIAAASPYFFPVDPERHYQYFARISRASPSSRLWLYVFPERTGNPLDVVLLGRLLELPGLYGAKVSSPGVETVAWLVSVSDRHLRVLSGSDPDLVEAFAAGARGLVSGLCCLAPALYVKLAAAVERGDRQGVNEAGNAISGLRGALGDGVGAIKAVLRHQGFPVGHPRMAVADPEPRGLVTGLASMGALGGVQV